ncbi:MAG TPA: DUF364 domain-containing protein [Xanthobacteraceae bacterium]|jgi:hypothetical protein
MWDGSFRQPHDALVTHAFTLEAAEQWALARASPLSADRLRITAFWHLDSFQQRIPGEIKRRYTRRLAQAAENYGMAIGLASPLQDTHCALVGEDSRAVLKARQYHDDIDRTALIDLVMGHISVSAAHQVMLDEVPRNKHVERSRLFAEEAENVIRRKGLKEIKGSKPRILVVGATAGMIGVLVNRGFEVSATDMYPDAEGADFYGVKVCADTQNGDLIKVADIAIITGMTLANRTLPGLVEAAKIHNTSTMMWAITGRNFGQYYVEHGVDCVISDPSPFFSLPGPANIGIWRREL